MEINHSSGAQAQPDICVKKIAPHRARDYYNSRRRVNSLVQCLGKSEQVHGYQSAKTGKYDIERMRARGDEPINVFRRVVDGMEAPQK